MKKRLLLCFTLLFLATFSGCAPTRIWTSTPAFETVQNQQFSVQFMPLRNDKNFINQFRLVITNRSDSQIEIDWKSTRYLLNSRPHGHFIFEGVDADTVNNPPSDFISAGDTFLKVIAPVRLVAWQAFTPGFMDKPSFSAGPVPEGENGIDLIVKQNDKVFRTRMTVTIKIAVK
jgi:hypothetical protein